MLIFRVFWRWVFIVNLMAAFDPYSTESANRRAVSYGLACLLSPLAISEHDKQRRKS